LIFESTSQSILDGRLIELIYHSLKEKLPFNS